MKKIALIPCRGGSKGVIRKNLQLVGGIPLVSKSIRTAKQAGFDQIYVSTEDPEIALFSRCEGASIINRPKELAKDDTSTDAVLVHALQEMSKNGATLDSILALIQVTTPFTQVQTLMNMCELVKTNPTFEFMTVTDWHGFIWNQNKTNGQISGSYQDPYNRKRRQDLDKQFLETGGAYVSTVANFIKTKKRFSELIKPYVVSRYESIEIDSYQDLNICNRLNFIDKRELPSKLPRLLVSDFDGVMTNNKIIINEDMAEKAIVTRFDGVGVEILKSMNIEVVILSGEKKGPAFARAKKLKVGHLTSNDKVSSLYRLASEKSLLMNQVAFVGNAENDLGCFRSAGISFAPSDSIPAAQNLADVLLKSRGGEGAIYELANFFRRCNTDSVLK